MANYTVQLTAPVGNYPFNDVRVSLTCVGQQQQTETLTFQPNARTQQHVFNIANGTWRLRITGKGFVPVDEQNINVNGNAVNAKNLTVMYYTLHTDRNRDGNPDGIGTLNTPTPNAISYGPNGIGAIIPVNCNRDGNNTAAGYADNQDQRINGNPDLPTGIARVEIRRNIVGPNANVPGNWALRLHINRANFGEEPMNHGCPILYESDLSMNHGCPILSLESRLSWLTLLVLDTEF